MGVDTLFSEKKLGPGDPTAMLEILKLERQLARRRLNDAHDPFIHRMPSHVVTKVLMEDRRNHPPYKDTARPLVLASVSRAWRNTIFAIPEVWAAMGMRRTRPCWDFPLKLVEEWLARAGSLPLRIALSWNSSLEYDYALPLRRIEQLLHLIRKESHRMEKLKLDVPPSVLDILDLNSTPLLRSFSITLLDSDFSWANFKYGLLTEVNVYIGLSTLEVFELLGLCVNLVRCTLCVQQVDGEITPDELPMTPIVLTRLEHLGLKLRFRNPQCLPNWISLPKLRRFEIETLQPEFDLLPYGAMLQRSGCVLRSFSYDNNYMDRKALDDLAPFLRTIPTIQELFVQVDFKDITLQGDLYSTLCNQLVSADLPNFAHAGTETLSELQKMAYYGPMPFTWSEYADMCELHAKQRMFPSIRLVVYLITRGGSNIDEETRSRLKALPQKTRQSIRIKSTKALDPPALIAVN